MVAVGAAAPTIVKAASEGRDDGDNGTAEGEVSNKAEGKEGAKES